MAAETAYRKDQFTATFLPAMALKVLNRAEVNAAKKGCRKDRDYKFTGSSQRSKDDGFPMWFRANVCTGKFEDKTLIGKWSLSLGRVEGGVWPDEADLLVLVRTLFTCATKLVREKPPYLQSARSVVIFVAKRCACDGITPLSLSHANHWGLVFGQGDDRRRRGLPLCLVTLCPCALSCSDPGWGSVPQRSRPFPPRGH